MSGRHRILVLSDTTDFGGHERAFFTLLPGLLDSPLVELVHFAFFGKNEKLLGEVARIHHPKFKYSTTPFKKRRGEPFFGPFGILFRRFVRRLIKQTQADTLLALQGRIETLCSIFFLPLRHVDLVSYIPMAHSVAEMGLRLGWTGVPDSIRRFYYAQPERFIVPSKAVEQQLVRAGAKGKVSIAPNITPLPARTDQIAARLSLGLPPEGRIALFMGRFDTHQKGLDRLSSAIAASSFHGWRFVFVGQGPGVGLVQSKLQAKKASGDVYFVRWTDAPNVALCAADALIMPSRFEGVPLLMLEAMSLGVPIIGSKIDIFEEYLLSEQLIDFGSRNELSLALDRAVDPVFLARYHAHADTLLSTLDIKKSQAVFLAGVVGRAGAP